MPANKGLFLAETYRLHPDIARFTSEAYYEGKVTAHLGLENQAVVPLPGKSLELSGAGLRFVPVEHTGNQARSGEEAEVIARLVRDLLAGGAYQDKDRQTHALRAQVNLALWDGW